MMTIMLKTKSIEGITQEHLALRTKQNWPPVLPKDRESVVNEATNRMATNLGSPEQLLELLGDTEDIDEVLVQMKSWIEFIEEAKAKAAQKFAPEPVPTGTADKGRPNPSGSNRSAPKE
jgi:hypothetical protein